MSRPNFRSGVFVTPAYEIILLCVVLAAFSAIDAVAAAVPTLTNVEVTRTDAEVKILALLEGGAPAATQIRFSDDGRVMIFEVAGVANGVSRRNIQVRDERLELISIQSLPGGVRINLKSGDTREPFSGHVLEPVIVPRGLSLTIWRAGATTLPPLPAKGLPYDVSRFVLEYANQHPDNPPLSEIAGTVVRVGLTSKGFAGEIKDAEQVSFPISSVPAPHRFLPTGIRSVTEAIVHAFNERGIAGVYVEPDPDDIDPASSRDLRTKSKDLRLKIWTGRLLEDRTFASGSRVAEDESIDNPIHGRIKANSPVKPGDLLKKKEIDDYVARLNRHPGRTVGTAVSRAGEPGGAYLDYLVNEKKPWSAYAQLSNTGTESTGELRERFGFTHNQLTNRDDILQLDYITGDFDTVHAFFGSYTTPLAYDNRLRGGVSGSYVEYASDQLGQQLEFQGEQWHFSGEMIGTVWQRSDLFVDVFGGLRWQNISVDNSTGDTPIRSEKVNPFFLPEVGIVVAQRTPVLTFRGELSNAWNVPSVSGTSDSDITKLGRGLDGDVDIGDSSFEILRWDTFVSVYIDALLSDKSSSDDLPRAHEIYLGSRGQYAWGNVLAPQFQDVVTGLYAVRGYAQSIAAGDDVAILRAEYRIHVPRLLPVDSSPIELPGKRSFKLQPARSNDQPDWDFVVRGFVDLGRTVINKRIKDRDFGQELAGAGVGLELRLLDHFVFTADYGVALRSTDGVHNQPTATVNASNPNDTNVGDDQVYLTGTLIF